MNSQTIIININNNSKWWEVILSSNLIVFVLQIIYQELKDNKEKKQLTQNLEKAENTIKEVCNKLGINNLNNLPSLPAGKSLFDLINFYHKTPSDWQEKLKKSQKAEKRAEIKNSFLIAKLKQIEKNLSEETIRRINAEDKIIELEEQKRNYLDEIYWKKYGEDILLDYQIEQWTNEQLKDEKNQEILEIIDYKLWEKD